MNDIGLNSKLLDLTYKFLMNVCKTFMNKCMLNGCAEKGKFYSSF